MTETERNVKTMLLALKTEKGTKNQGKLEKAKNINNQEENSVP